MSGYDVRWQALTQHLVIQVGMHVGDDGTAWLEALEPRQRVIDTEMTGMPRVAQPVDNPQIKVFQKGPAFGRNVVDVRRVRRIRNPIAERGNIAVLHEECRKRHRSPLPFNGTTFSRLDRVT